MVPLPPRPDFFDLNFTATAPLVVNKDSSFLKQLTKLPTQFRELLEKGTNFIYSKGSSGGEVEIKESWTWWERHHCMSLLQ